MTDIPGKNPAQERLRRLLAPDQCAVILQEIQEGVVGATSGLPALAEAAEQSGLVAKAAGVSATARGVGVPVIHCTAQSLPGGFGGNTNARLFAGARKSGMQSLPGSDSVQPIRALGPFDSDIVLPRLHGLSPMTGSPLDSLLRNSGIRTVVVMGVSLNIAIPNLVFDAVNRSYQVVVVSDAVAGVPPEYGAQMIAHTLSLVATIAPSDEIVRIWSSHA